MVRKQSAVTASKTERERRALERTAYHEAGHSVAAMENNRAVRRTLHCPHDRTPAEDGWRAHRAAVDDSMR